MTIITLSCRINDLLEIKKSLNFEYIDEQIIVYDGDKIESKPNIFHGNNKIKEYITSSYTGEGISGNPQRNYALSKITNPNTLLIRRGGQRERVRGEYRFSSLMKQKKKGKIALSFASPEQEFLYL